MPDNIEINTDVSPSLHPASLTPHREPLDVPGTPGHAIYEAGRAALDALYREATLTFEAEKALLARKFLEKGRLETTPSGPRTTIGESEKILFREALDISFHRAGRAHDLHRQSIVDGIEALQRRVATALRDPDRDKASRAGVASDIRRHIAGLADISQRTTVLMAAARDGDIQVIDAVLSAPAIISGLDAQTVAAIRDAAELKLAPAERAQLDAAQKVLAAVENAGSWMVRLHKSKRPPEPENKKQTRAALARLKEGAAA